MTNYTKRVLAVSVIAAALIGASATSAMAADQTNGSTEAVYLYDAGSGELFDATSKHDFNYDVIGVPSATDLDARFQCSPDSTSVVNFIAPKGKAKDKSAWTAWAPSGFIIGSEQEVAQYPMTLSGMINGAPLSVRAAGGDYDAGMACMLNNDVTFAERGLWFNTIHVTPVTGVWTADATVDAGVVTPTDPTLSAEIPVTATTINAPEGVLTLSVPAGTTAAIGTPTLVDGLSTSTGTLGAITVNDGRVQGKQGWTLTTAVDAFTSSADATVTIPAAQLGITPKVIAASTTAVGVTAAAASTPGSATAAAPFAEASAGSKVGTTVLDADLKFVAPADKAAGTYTSKVTLTLASK